MRLRNREWLRGSINHCPGQCKRVSEGGADHRRVCDRRLSAGYRANSVMTFVIGPQGALYER
jgi:hypothetical protein